MEPHNFDCRQCTFLAGVQAAILTVTATQTGVTAQIVNGFFFAGLVADIGAAILSAASQRWFEMIRRDEAEHAYDYLNGTGTLPEIRLKEDEQLVVDEKTDSSFTQTMNVAVGPPATDSKRYFIIELWLILALKAPPYAAVLGFMFMVAGVMLWVWSHEGLVAKVLCTILCVLLVI